MKAAIFKGKGKIEIGQRDNPIIKVSTDAIVRVVLSCVCGSDLWYYRGESEFPINSPIGHEFIGIIEEIGKDVKTLKKGDFVISPFAFSDGTCPNCLVGINTACLNGGFYPQNGDGGQGEFVRVPYADGTLVSVPNVSKLNYETLKSLLTLSDVMGTGFHAAHFSEVKKGDTVAVVGDGAVGLCGVISAKLLGAERIILLSRNENRQKLAQEFGVTDVVEERGEEAIQKILEITNNIGVDATLECVGTNESIQTAIKITRPGSIMSNVGIPHGIEIPANFIFSKNIGIHGGPAPVRAYLKRLLKDVLEEKINPGKVFDYETDLDHIADAYMQMDTRKAIKSLLKVSNI